MILLDAFRAHALLSPGALILQSDGDDAMTYREAWNVSELLGAHLIERTEKGELSAGCTVAVLGEAHPLLLSCCLACTKSGHAYRLFSDAELLAAAQMPLILTASESIAADDLRSLGATFLDAHKIRTYIVPGMTDDFSCGCGTEDCEHGPFLQECWPGEWLDDQGVFAECGQLDAEACASVPAQIAAAQTAPAQITAKEHDALLEAALNAPEQNPCFSPPLDLVNPRLAAVITLGESVSVQR
ncbi:MAG: hypothetical protein LBU48_02080 [Coriobacteriales bacterium]|nr:hypothetical protein [Coriobacteriales bacterium]